MLRDIECMHAHGVSNIHGMVIFFSLSVLVYMFEHVTGLWLIMDRSGNVCKKKLFLCNLAIRIRFRYPIKRIILSYNYLLF